METIFLSHLHIAAYRRDFEAKRINVAHSINVGSRPTHSLDGTWQILVDQYDTCLRAGWYAYGDEPSSPVDCTFEGWETIEVPSCWNQAKGEWTYYESSMLYSRTFTVVQPTPQRSFLCFEGVANRCFVFLNGTYLGYHEGANTPFAIEITDYLQIANRLLVSVDATRSALKVPSDNTDWFNYGGIYREVSLVHTPPSFIKDWFVRLQETNTLSFEVWTEGDGSGSLLFASQELGIHVALNIEYGYGSLLLPFDGTCWSPSSPKLYEFTLQFGEDKVVDLIGLRTIETRGSDLLLNGKKLFLKGVCLHEDHPVMGKTVTQEMVMDTLQDAMQLGCNLIRLSHYPRHRQVARLADELGILLWEELPVYWGIAFDQEQTLEDAKIQLTEMIYRDRNRSSVIIWSVGNENPDTDARYRFVSTLTDLAKALDPSRLVGAACLVNEGELRIQDRLEDSLDVIGLNEYYGWYDGNIGKLGRTLENSRKDKPMYAAPVPGYCMTSVRRGG